MWKSPQVAQTYSRSKGSEDEVATLAPSFPRYFSQLFTSYQPYIVLVMPGNSTFCPYKAGQLPHTSRTIIEVGAFSIGNNRIGTDKGGVPFERMLSVRLNYNLLSQDPQYMH